MYPIETFHVTDLAEIRAFVDKYPFATLVATDAHGEFAATHVPLLVHTCGERIVFRGHVMRDTNHWRALQYSPKVLVSFLGPDAPVLGSWQLTRAFGGTWNYQAVHARGVAQGRDGETLLRHLQELKDRFEVSPGHKFDSLPSGYVEALVPMIECIDIEVSDLKCIFKLSQNRRVEEYDLTVEHLKRAGGKAALVAREMEERRAAFYPPGVI